MEIKKSERKAPAKSLSSTPLNACFFQDLANDKTHTYLSEKLNKFQISFPDWKLLDQIHQSGKMRLTVLARRLNYAPPMVTKLTKKLEKKGLVKRVADIRDERAKVINLTSKGIGLVQMIEPEIKKSYRKIFRGVTADDLQIYMKTLNTIIKNADQ